MKRSLSAEEAYWTQHDADYEVHRQEMEYQVSKNYRNSFDIIRQGDKWVYTFEKSYHCRVSKHLWNNHFLTDFHHGDLSWYTDCVTDVHSHDPDDTTPTRILGISSKTYDFFKLCEIGEDIEEQMRAGWELLELTGM